MSTAAKVKARREASRRRPATKGGWPCGVLRAILNAMASTLFLEPLDDEPLNEAARRSATLDRGIPQDHQGGSPLVSGRDLIIARWMMMASQAIGVFIVAQLMKLPLPLAALTLVVGLGVVMNIAVILLSGTRRPPPLEQAGYLVFDVIQLTILLSLTGGSTNPFCLALIFPARMAATMLPFRYSLFVFFLILISCAFLVVTPFPTPWPSGVHINLPMSYRIACGVAAALGAGFGVGFGWWTARQASRMELALHLTDTFLARQQRLSALGGLAAAAAHELGTPLTTIAVIAKEMARDAPQGSLREDAWLLVEQAGRCREILRRLTKAPDTGDALQARVGLSALVDELSAPFSDRRNPPVETMIAGPPNHSPPTLWRLPEVEPALSSIVENAVDFARGEVRIVGRFDARFVSIEIRDDGPGFEPDILIRLGEPYVTSRADAELSRGGHIGMGLGVFIAKTLLERTGAKVTFSNARAGGAVVTARWRRYYIEAPALVDDANS
jgi:two-component system sensor histidine kinase RegB